MRLSFSRCRLLQLATYNRKKQEITDKNIVNILKSLWSMMYKNFNCSSPLYQITLLNLTTFNFQFKTPYFNNDKKIMFKIFKAHFTRFTIKSHKDEISNILLNSSFKI